MHLKKYLNDKRGIIDEYLGQWFKNRDDRLIRAMRHSLFAGGKRLRPILCMAAAEAVHGDPEAVLPCACAIELIHTYSLIHDDLPAMDDDDLRRGQPTCHKAFDEATAILAGDALLTLAFQKLAIAGLHDPDNAASWIEAVRMIASAAGMDGMILGQMLDMQAESVRLDMAGLEEMHRKKTGALIRASVTSGALLANGSKAEIAALDDFAAHIGLAFQVADDILNVTGDPEVMGKAAGSDEARHKSTYPSLLGLGPSGERAGQLVNKALKAVESFDNNTDPLRRIAQYVIERKR